ncbi:MAG: ribosome maturation factor RimM [Suipraeoptans sp.]
MEDLLRVGVISSTHGIRGEVKVFPTTDDKEDFLEFDSVILDTKREHKVLEIENVKFFKQFAILKFKGIDNINDIEMYKGMDLLVKRGDTEPLSDDEYYFADLLGMKVSSDEGEELGEIVDIIETGANDVYVIKGPKYEQLLIPAIKPCILNVDVANGKMLIHILEGLI